MKKWIFLGMGILGIFSLTAFNAASNSTSSIEVQQPNEIIATINKNTTEKELEDLKTFFSENGIELIIDKIEFNDQNEITSLSIILKKGKSKSKYSSSSTEPISDVELGYKNGNLYITNSGMFDIASWKNQIGFNHHSFDMDSLLKNQNFSFNFDFDFDKEGDSLFFNGKHFDMGKLKDQIMNSFEFDEDENGNFIFNGQQFPSHFSKSKKFRFVDDPDIEKLIIIDGKESDFKTLDELAKSDKLEEVDFLKPTIATSIYGDKAKDGAIIAITKK
ncbi:hypothetical protein [Aquimarina sp. 2201CG14-23]|uniref:hypothetical protein n=1 Tax=Aquimarina mycalae TaxID=3040073 RepID=UPI0024780DD0|nr:hypothetical protein [Aquimarina sp. 2201CG14-23]MDH7444642.1 hypothetical protein [Aquimarina sp. 2201CG14-23]